MLKLCAFVGSWKVVDLTKLVDFDVFVAVVGDIWVVVVVDVGVGGSVYKTEDVDVCGKDI